MSMSTPKRDFNTLSYLSGQAPEAKAVRTSIDRIVLPILLD